GPALAVVGADRLVERGVEHHRLAQGGLVRPRGGGAGEKQQGQGGAGSGHGHVYSLLVVVGRAGRRGWTEGDYRECEVGRGRQGKSDAVSELSEQVRRALPGA